MLALAAIALSLTPQDSFQSLDLEMAARRVEQDLTYARERAHITNNNCGIQFVANGNYTAYQNTISTPLSNPHTNQSLIVNLSDTYDNVNVATTLNVEFDPNGRPVMGGGQTLSIAGINSAITLLVTSNTGLIQRQ